LFKGLRKDIDDQKAEILRLNAEHKTDKAERKVDKEELVMYSKLFHQVQEELKADRESYEDATTVTTRLNRLAHQEQEAHKAEADDGNGTRL
jgi:hypothetical protein